MRFLLSLLLLALPSVAWSNHHMESSGLHEEEAEAAEEGGAALFFSVGVEDPAGKAHGSDLLACFSVGLEAEIGEEGAWSALGKFSKVGLANDVDITRWNYGLLYWFESYWPDLRPFGGGGLEHQATDFLVGNTNLTWFCMGIQPKVGGGWLNAAYESSGFGQDESSEHRVIVSYVLGTSQYN